MNSNHYQLFTILIGFRTASPKLEKKTNFWNNKMTCINVFFLFQPEYIRQTYTAYAHPKQNSLNKRTQSDAT